MSNCPDLCTAEKCRELEAKIEILTNQVKELLITLTDLEIFVDKHVNDYLSYAHEFDLGLSGYTSYDFVTNGISVNIDFVNNNGNVIGINTLNSLPLPLVTEWDFDEHKNLAIPYAHTYLPLVDILITPQPDGSKKLAIGVDGNIAEAYFDTEILTLEINEVNNLDYLVTVELGVKKAYSGFQITKEDLKDFLPDIEEYVTNNDIDIVVKDSIEDWFNQLKFYFRIDDLSNNDWRFTIQLGEKVRSQILDLPRFGGGGGGGGETEPPDTTVSLSGNYNAENNNLNFSVTVDGVSSTISINLDDMPFENIENLLNQILTAVTLEVEGVYEIGKTKTDLEDENGNKQLSYSSYQTVNEGQEGYIDTSYTGVGFNGVNQALLNLDKKIVSLHKDLARAIDPELPIEVVAPTNCYTNVSRDDYTNEEWELIPTQIQNEIEKDIGDRFRDFIRNSPVLSEIAEPLLRAISSLAFKIPNLPAFFAVNFASNYLITQLRDDNQVLDCSYVKSKLPTEIETITIVASPEVQASIRDTVLVLDFTTVEAFPNLNEKKSKWRVQIPAPIEDIDWDKLKDIRWNRGDQFGQIRFKGRRNTTSGWFADKDSLESYFGQIASLTTLEVENIICPIHENPKISPAQINTRVYRAFKVFVGENGEPNNSLTEVFKPSLENESV